MPPKREKLHILFQPSYLARAGGLKSQMKIFVKIQNNVNITLVDNEQFREAICQNYSNNKNILFHIIYNRFLDFWMNCLKNTIACV